MHDDRREIIPIVLINQSDLEDAEIQQAIEALQLQLDVDFSPVWGLFAQLSFVGKGQEIIDDSWQIIIKNRTPKEAEYDGYHSQTPRGNPIGYVFALDNIDMYGEWTSTASHEILEMIVDPPATLWAFDLNTGLFHAYEVADACQDRVYDINEITVSDFLYPSWFESNRKKNSTQFNFKNTIKRPFEIDKGGYSQVFQFGSDEIYQLPKPRKFDEIPYPGSRRKRRQDKMKQA